MKIVAICLARIESKRLPKKLLLPLDGRPMIAYTLDIMERLGIDMGIESHIYTDSNEIKRMVSEKYPHVRAHDKPEKYCQDKHVTGVELREYNKTIKADIFVYLAGTSPVRKYEEVIKAIRLFKVWGCYDSAMGVRKIPKRMYWKGIPGDMMPANYTSRSYVNIDTDRKDIYEETGSIYIFKKKMLKKDFFVGKNTMLIYEDDVYDIDTAGDFARAEKYMKGEK